MLPSEKSLRYLILAFVQFDSEPVAELGVLSGPWSHQDATRSDSACQIPQQFLGYFCTNRLHQVILLNPGKFYDPIQGEFLPGHHDLIIALKDFGLDRFDPPRIANGRVGIARWYRTLGVIRNSRCRMILGWDLSIEFLLGVVWCPVFPNPISLARSSSSAKNNGQKGQRRQGTWNMPPISQVQALWAIQILKALKALNQPGPCGNLEFVQKSVWETPPALN